MSEHGILFCAALSFTGGFLDFSNKFVAHHRLQTSAPPMPNTRLSFTSLPQRTHSFNQPLTVGMNKHTFTRRIKILGIPYLLMSLHLTISTAIRAVDDLSSD